LINYLINLVAERLLCLQMNTDGQVQKCIFEVLHREATNVVVVCNLFDLINSNNQLFIFFSHGKKKKRNFN